MAAWKIAPALAMRQHDRAQARRDHPAHRVGARRDRRRGRAARRACSTCCPARATSAPRVVAHPGVDEGGVHRLHRRRQADPAHARGHRQAAHAGAGRQGGQHRVRRRGAGPGRRGRRRGDLLQPGPRVLRGLAAARAGVDRRRADGAAAGADHHAAGGRPAGQEHRRRRDQLPGPARQDRRPRGRGRRRGRPALDQPVPAARARPVLPAHGVLRASSRRCGWPARRSSARCCRCSRSARPPRPSPRPTTPPTACPPGCGRTRAPRRCGPAAQLRAGVVWTNTFNRFDPTSPFGGMGESGFGREGGRAGLAAYLDG